MVKRLLRFRLRTLLGIVLCFAFAFALWNREVRRQAQEERALAEINQLAVSVEYYDRAPRWLRGFIGDSRMLALRTVVGISFPPDGVLVDFGNAHARVLGINDGRLEGLRPQLEQLPYLASLNLQDSPELTDIGLKHLSGLTSLRRLNVRYTAVTDRGIREMQRSLPRLVIDN